MINSAAQDDADRFVGLDLAQPPEFARLSLGGGDGCERLRWCAGIGVMAARRHPEFRGSGRQDEQAGQNQVAENFGHVSRNSKQLLEVLQCTFAGVLNKFQIELPQTQVLS